MKPLCPNWAIVEELNTISWSILAPCNGHTACVMPPLRHQSCYLFFTKISHGFHSQTKSRCYSDRMNLNDPKPGRWMRWNHKHLLTISPVRPVCSASGICLVSPRPPVACLIHLSYSTLAFHRCLIWDRNFLFLSLIPAPLPKVQRNCKLTFKNTCSYFLSLQSTMGTEIFFIVHVCISSIWALVCFYCRLGTALCHQRGRNLNWKIASIRLANLWVLVLIGDWCRRAPGICCRDHSWPTGCELLSSFDGYMIQLLNLLSLFTQTFLIINIVLI